MSLVDNIKKNEGFSSKIYIDTLGHATIGYGFAIKSLTQHEIFLNGGRVEPMSKENASEILIYKIEKLKEEVFKTFTWLKSKPHHIQNVVIEMCYQIGVHGVKKFYTTMHYIRNNEFERAYENGLNSLWAKQTPARAKRVLSGLLKGQYSE